MDNVKRKMDVYYDYRAPSVVVEIPEYRNGYSGILKRGGQIRVITEITKDNFQYCKELMKIVTELRHLDGIKGGLAVSETEYMSSTTLQIAIPMPQVFYSNVREVVQHEQYVFDTFWNKSIPAEHKIKEIEEGAEPERTEIIEGSENIQKITVERFSKIKERADCCYDSTIPMIIPSLEPIMKSWTDFTTKRKGKIRIITEI